MSRRVELLTETVIELQRVEHFVAATVDVDTLAIVGVAVKPVTQGTSGVMTELAWLINAVLESGMTAEDLAKRTREGSAARAILEGAIAERNKLVKVAA